MRLHVTAVEASGDALAAETIDAIRALAPDVEFAGIGGEQMAARGVSSDFDSSQLAIFGITDAIMSYGRVVKLADAAAAEIIAAKPDAAILVDSWGFCLRVARRVRAAAPGIRLIKLVGPQVWATRPGRAETLAETFDQVLCLLPMELPFYEGRDVRADLIGVPALSRAEPADGEAFRTANGIPSDAPLLLVLPGSRPSEIRRVAPTLLHAAAAVKAERPGLRVFAAPPPSVAEAFAAVQSDLDIAIDTVSDPAQRFAAMAAADVALVCSGTVTSEVAAQGTAMVVAYKVGVVTWMIARHLLYKHEHVTLFNIAAGDTAIAPEFLQGDMRVGALATAVRERLDDAALRERQVSAQNRALALMGMGAPPAAELAAKAILEGLGQSA